MAGAGVSTGSPSITDFPIFPYGASIQGVPVIPSISGKVFWVDSNTGSDGNEGTQLRPWATVKNVVAKVTTGSAGYQPKAGRGDVVFVRAGHTETISDNTSYALSVSGIQIVGIGAGNLRPTFTLDTATTTTINVSADGINFTNCLFIANFAAIASVFTLTTAKDFGLFNCEFRDTSSVLNFVKIVTTGATTNAADGLKISGCRRIGLGATAATALVGMAGINDRLEISSNYVSHNATTAGSLVINASNKYVTNALILNNLVLTPSTTATAQLINAPAAGNTGFIDGNRYRGGSTITTPTTVTASSGFSFGSNLAVHTADKSGYVIPVIDASS